MPIYEVAEMRLDRIIRSRAVEACSPDAAALIMNSRRSISQKWEKDWVRVTDENDGRVFAFTIARRERMADDKEVDDPCA